MADIRNLSWEIVIPPEIDWLVISPSRGTGYARVNVSIIHSEQENPASSATVTLYCTSCNTVIKKELEIERCNLCDCDDLEYTIRQCTCKSLSTWPICDCEGLHTWEIEVCDCDDLEATIRENNNT